jgi:hypothetical protein
VEDNIVRFGSLIQRVLLKQLAYGFRKLSSMAYFGDGIAVRYGGGIGTSDPRPGVRVFSGTSDTSSETCCAADAATASLPPLIAERCLRMVLISAMGAPECTNTR